MRMMTATRTEKFWARVNYVWPEILAFLTYFITVVPAGSVVFMVSKLEFPWLVDVVIWTVIYSLYKWKIHGWLVAHYRIWMAG